MQARGHSSISPPEQINQPRHGNQVSNTPPPQATQQYYPQAFQRFEYITGQQDQSLLQYKAYGSALNEPRAPGNGARVGIPQTNIQQPAGNFYQQPTQTMRPPQPQQGPAAQQALPLQYFISTPAQPRTMRPQQPMAPSTTLVYMPPQSFPGNNVVIPAPNMYQRVPQYQQVSYTQYAPTNYMYYQSTNGWPNVGIPQATANARPENREKKILSITDPNTGKDITTEILSSKGHHADSDEHREDAPTMTPADQEIRKTFTKLVADRLNTPDESNSSSASETHLTVHVPSAITVTATQPSQFQQGNQQVPHSQPALNSGPVLLPHTRPALIHSSGSATPPQEISYVVDTTIPPPNIRPQATVYNAQQQQPHLASRIVQPQPHQAPQQRSQLSHSNQVQQQSAPTMQAAHLPQSNQMPQVTHTSSINDVTKPVPLKSNTGTEKIETETSRGDIPVFQAQTIKIATPSPQIEIQSSPVPESDSESKPAIYPAEQPVKEKEISTGECAQTNDEPVLEESSVSKDGKKNSNNKKKKDINRKEIAGTDMDAFIDDKENETVECISTKPPISPPIDESKHVKDKAIAKDVKSSDVTTDTTTKEIVISSSVATDRQSQILDKTPETDLEKPLSVDRSISQTISQPVVTEIELPPVQNEVLQNNQTEDIEVQNNVLTKSLIVEKTNEKNLQINKMTIENDISKEPLFKIPVDGEGKKNVNVTDSSTPNKPSPDSLPKTDGTEVRRYDRDQLIRLRDCLFSQTKPKGLPNFEIIMDSPIEPGRNSSMATDFTPIFVQSAPNNQRHPPSMGKTSSRGRQRVGEATRIIKPISANDKPLHQSEKPWKPSPKLVYAGEITEKRKSLESDVLFIMNRLTPTNFERLAVEMRNLNIQTYEELTDLVKIFFDKVTMETKFVEAYALLCKVMSSIKVPPPPGMKENQATFRVVMLTKCQQEFEADKSIIFEDPEEKKKKIESEMPEGNERNEKIEATLYQMKLKRLKFYGNIRFIGELFKLGMLTENIMHDCIYRLLKARDDDSLVSLCQLLTTVGSVLDTEKAKVRMDQYFNQMGKIAEERKSRIKFTLKDAIDLRNNNWVPRKEQTGPKKIDEVHKDFQQEQFTKQLMQSQPPPPRTDIVQPNSRRGSRQRQDDLKAVQDDGWNTVGSKSLRIDASKMKLSKNIVDENSIQLGPGGGTSKFAMWGRGSFGGSQPSQDDRPAPAPSNRFSLLRAGGGGGAGEEDRRNYQKSPSRGDNVANRGIRQGPTVGHGRGKILSRSITEGERRDALGNTWPASGGRSQNSSRDNSWNREDHRTLGPRGSRERDNIMTSSDITPRPSSENSGPAAGGDVDEPGIKKIHPLSEKEMEHKAKTILEEYLSVMDLEEAKLCLKELKGQAYLDILVSACINDVLEKTKQKRELTGQFFHEMVRNKLIPLDIYLKGLSEVLQIAEDMVIDIPMIWSYLAQIISPLLIGGSVPWSDLSPALKTNIEKKCAGKLISEILLIAKETKDETEAAQLWHNSGLNWSMFLEESEIDKFLQDKKLEFTLAPVKAGSQSKTSQVFFDRITQEIEKIAKENGNNKEILNYIEKNVPQEMQQQNEFIRALVTAIASSCITSTKKPSDAIKNCIKSRKDVLQLFIKSNVDLELQALYAIQALMHKLEHPSNVIATLFDVLNDEDIISDEACKKWEQSTDPLEAEGKGACLMQLTQFFAWLKENEDPETS
ncbi:eukaryotic translation initiation factor 4 gamma 3-like isoform X6 [Biomphalaria glabrata]|uniref:Eukaryotic translation initiation factor 4 gamma 3-like isoform X6 n=1 Tax=Biomphalaria glabrata TaxID=6526 RepID=A0A9W2YPJ6_BIOGL|nr:eukaryotic translation initiation factor 4 gamma 3-like isoform X6 [Biomphalaria glabrata]